MGLLKIKSFRLIDIQSWDNDSPAIELAEDKNIIIANSETGKSVLFKVLKQMCFNNVWGYKNSELIRQGSSRGLAVFDLLNGNRVVFELLPNTQNYYLCTLESDGSKRRTDFIMGTKSVEIPEAVAKEMGFLLDRKSKTIINVLDRDMQMPLVTTSPATSGRILSAVTENPELESMMDTAKSWLKEAKDKRDVVSSTYLSAKSNYESVEYKDTTITKNTIALLKVMRTLGEAFNEVKSKGRAIENQFQVQPKYLKSFNYLSFLKSVQELLSVSKDGETLREALDKVPKNDSYSEEELRVFQVFVLLCPMVKDAERLKGFLSSRPVKVSMPQELNEFKGFMEFVGTKLLEEGKTLREVVESKPSTVKFPKFLKFSQSLLVLGLVEKGEEVKKVLEEGKTLREKERLSREKLNQVKKKTSFCPLCLRPYSERGDGLGDEKSFY